MSHTPRLSSGYSFKRFLNAKRLRASESHIVPTDPFFDDVFLLLPFNVAGDNFGDLSNESANNNLVIDGTGAQLLTVDNTRELFGFPTLHIVKETADGQLRLLYQNLTYAIGAGFDVCMELWAYTESNNGGTSSPNFSFVRQQSAPGVFLGNGFLFRNGSSTIQLFATSVGSGASQPIVKNAWQYICAQYVASEGKVYCYANGNVYSVLTTTLAVLAGFQHAINISSTNTSYDVSIAQVRLTRANRYGINSGNYLTNIPPTPIAPWPTTGP